MVQSDEGNHGILLAVGGETFELSAHPRVLHAPNDPSMWTGLALQSSWLTQGEADEEQWLQILIFGDPPDSQPDGGERGAAAANADADADAAADVDAATDVAANPGAANANADAANEDTAHHHAAVQANSPGEDANGIPSVWVWIAIVGIAALGIGSWMAVKRRSQG